MITIQIDGNTYQPKGDINHRNIGNFIMDYISLGYLEEVKENKDSILEKLRNEMEETQEEYANHQMWSERKVVQNILDLLTSLETKEEPTHKGEHQNDVCSKVTPQFTPGQEIEVSNDKELWGKRYFLRKSIDTGQFICKGISENEGKYRGFKFARPIEDKIELLPAYEPSEPDWRDTQISLLTRTVNQLISK